MFKEWEDVRSCDTILFVAWVESSCKEHCNGENNGGASFFEWKRLATTYLAYTKIFMEIKCYGVVTDT